MNLYVTDKDGNKKPAWLASYGIGVTRLIAAIVEVSHDERGMIWPEAVSPFKVHLVGLDLANRSVKSKVYKVYKALREKSVEVLFDDIEDKTAGEKFADADLIGIPNRLVISERTGDKIEYKKRDKKETKLLGLDEVFKTL